MPYSINTAGEIVIDGSRTLTPGGTAVTVSGATVSGKQDSGTSQPEIVVVGGGGKTTEALGNIIMSGFRSAKPTGTVGVGQGHGSSATTSAESFRGEAGAARWQGLGLLVSINLASLVYTLLN